MPEESVKSVVEVVLNLWPIVLWWFRVMMTSWWMLYTQTSSCCEMSLPELDNRITFAISCSISWSHNHNLWQFASFWYFLLVSNEKCPYLMTIVNCSKTTSKMWENRSTCLGASSYDHNDMTRFLVPTLVINSRLPVVIVVTMLKVSSWIIVYLYWIVGFFFL